MQRSASGDPGAASKAADLGSILVQYQLKNPEGRSRADIRCFITQPSRRDLRLLPWNPNLSAMAPAAKAGR